MSQQNSSIEFREHIRAEAAADRMGVLLESYRPLLRGFARRHSIGRLSRRIDGSDIVQDTLIKALDGWSGFHGSTEREFVAWLRRILVRRIIDMVRRNDASAARVSIWGQNITNFPGLKLLDRSAGVTPAPDATNGVNELVQDALAKLPPDYRQIIRLRHFRGLTLSQSAEEMGRSYDSAEKLWARALKSLRPLLKDVRPGATS